jgi:hypothetical protein
MLRVKPVYFSEERISIAVLFQFKEKSLRQVLHTARSRLANARFIIAT